ncbi:MAG: hypothetical protein H5U38_14765 [Calditrichaeota bacterium]|nr:hypothetical protein [Calditrichota bacterium]
MLRTLAYVGAGCLAVALLWLACGERITGEKEAVRRSGAAQQQLEARLCCNNIFPSEQNPPGAEAGMYCGAPPDHVISCETCARYWSAYGPNPTEMCQYLPGEPPLPDVPVPAEFAVHVTANHPQLVWSAYWVHAYCLERKIGGGAWTLVATLTDHEADSWTDQAVTIPDPKGRAIWYRMRGRVYGTYSSYTEELQAMPEEQRVVP